MLFRKDINGLRAIAVIAVVLFHFKPAWMSGGFAGVDVFFVISGFLMTSIIFRGFEKDNFSLTDFYLARAKRIIPALAVMCFVVLIATWFILSPVDYKTVGKHVASSIGFFSNIVFAKESGYFDAGSHEKWLLHTWSLSVEWQFYIIYPLILVVLRKYISLRVLKFMLCLAMLLSFIFSVIAVQMSPVNAYFSLPSRMWEMLLGGVAFLFPFKVEPSIKKFLQWTGIFLIVASYLFLSEKTPWPGYWAIFPVVGAFLLIQANLNDSFITSNPVFQAIGNWSYSIYLWHWPLVVIITIFSLSEIWTYSFLLLSFALGSISYQLIERKTTIQLKWVYLAFALLIIPVQLFGSQIYGIPKQLWSNINIDVKGEDYGAYTWRRINQLDKIERFGQTNKNKVLIIGDSQAGDTTNALFAANKNNDVELIARVVPALCGAFYLDLNELREYFLISKDIQGGLIPQSKCEQKISRVNAGNVISDADYIILSMDWLDYALPYVFKSISKLSQETTAKIYVLGNKGFVKNVPILIYDHFNQGTDTPLDEYVYDFISDRAYSNNRIFEDNASLYDYTFINLIEFLCVNNQCNTLNADGKPLYYDKMHSTKEGAEFFGTKLDELDFK